jgi:hypothetical protein
MSGRPWLDSLKGMLKEKVPAINVPEEFLEALPPQKVQKVRKPLLTPFCTFCTLATLEMLRNHAT